MRALEAAHGAHELDLHVERETRGDAVRIDLAGVEPFRLDEDLVRVTLGEPHHLVLHRRAVPWPRTVDHARVHGRPIQRGPDNLVGPLVGMRDVARHLRRVPVPAPEVREHRPRLVAGLWLEPGKVDGSRVDAGRRAGLQPPDREFALAQLPCQRVRRRVARAAALVILHAHMDAPAKERAHGHHHAGRLDANPDARHHPAHRVPVDDEVGDRLLEQREPWRALQHPANVAPVERAIDLGAGRPHRGTLAGVEGAEVDATVVRAHRHRPAEGVDLLDEVPLADPADGRVAAHLPEGLDALREQQRLRPGPGRGERRLGAGVTAADDDDVECPVVEHGDGRELWGFAKVPSRNGSRVYPTPGLELRAQSGVPRHCTESKTARSGLAGCPSSGG